MSTLDPVTPENGNVSPNDDRDIAGAWAIDSTTGDDVTNVDIDGINENATDEIADLDPKAQRRQLALEKAEAKKQEASNKRAERDAAKLASKEQKNSENATEKEDTGKAKGRLSRRNKSDADTSAPEAPSSEPTKGSGLRLPTRKGQQAAAQSVATNRREIPTAGFDLLNGAFRASARMRVVVLGVLAALLGLEALFLFNGLSARVQVAVTNSNVSALNTEQKKIMAAFGTATGLKDVSENDVIDRERLLTAAVRTAATTEPDIVSLYNDLRQIETPGVTVLSVGVTRPDVVKAPATTDGTKDKKTVKAPTGPQLSTFEIVAQGTDFVQVVSWSKRISGLTMLTDIKFVRTGLKVTITGKLSPAYLAQSASDLLGTLGIPLTQQPAAAPATGQASTPGSTPTTDPATGTATTTAGGR